MNLDHLDHLSARWQQQAPPLATHLSPAGLGALLAGHAHSPVAQMRRNAWVEIGGTLVSVLLVVAVLGTFGAPRLPWLLGGLALFYGGLAGCYVRTLQVLRRLRAASGEGLTHHVARQLSTMRRLLRWYHGATMLAALLLLGAAAYVAAWHVLPRLPAANTGRFLVWLVLTALVSYGVTHWVSRYHLQQYYGQHLDRLAAVLQELRDEPAGATPPAA